MSRNLLSIIKHSHFTLALGAAALAGLGVGFWDGREALSRSRGEVQRFEPQLGEAERDALYRGWQRAVERSRDWAE